LKDIERKMPGASFPCWKCKHPCAANVRHCPRCSADLMILRG